MCLALIQLFVADFIIPVIGPMTSDLDKNVGYPDPHNRVQVDSGCGELNPLLNFQPPCILHLQPPSPGDQLSHPGPSF